MELLIRTAEGRTRAAHLPEVLEVAARYRARRAERAQINLTSPARVREFLASGKHRRRERETRNFPNK